MLLFNQIQPSSIHSHSCSLFKCIQPYNPTEVFSFCADGIITALIWSLTLTSLVKSLCDGAGRVRSNQACGFFCPPWLIGGRRTHPRSFQAPSLLVEGGWTFQCLTGGENRLRDEQNCSVGEGWREHGSAFVPREENGKRDGFERLRFVLQLSSSDITGEELHRSSDACPRSHDSGQHFIRAEQNALNIFGQFLPLEVSGEGQKSQRKGVNVTGWFLRAPVQQASLQRRDSWGLFKIPKWLKRGLLWACDYAKTKGISGARNLEA